MVPIVSERHLCDALARLTAAQPRVVVSGNFATPRRVLQLLDETVESFRLVTLNAHDPLPHRADVIHETAFVGPGVRHSPCLEYLPMRLSLLPRLFAVRPPDVVVLHTSSPRQGKLSMGIEVNILPAALAAAKRGGGLVVAQINPAMPYTYGDGEVELDAVDVAVEVEEPLATLPPSVAGDEPAEIGSRISRVIDDGATLQLGIGHIPDSVLAAIGDRSGLGIWSEMISDGVLALERHRALDPARPITASFLFGSEELYRWVDRNERLQMLRTETVNNPSRIARNHAMTSINTAMQVDLNDQANASYVDRRIYSGMGGQPDFTVGALHSRGGQAIIGLPSWHQKTACSTIVPRLSSPATSFQHSAVVTEIGWAEMFGRSQKAQVRLLIEEAAHPKARDELWRAAVEMGLAYPKETP